MQVDWIALARRTIEAPKDAAEEVRALGLSRDVLWTALALSGVLNTFIVVLLFETSATPDGMPLYAASPLAMFFLITGLLVVYVHVLCWTARALGGEGDLLDLLALIVWFQFVRGAAQIVVMLTSLVLPGLALVLSFAVTLGSFWIFLNFLAVGMRLNSITQALVVFVLSGLGIIFGLAVLFSIIGFAA